MTTIICSDYTSSNSILDQAVALPSLLRPLFTGESQKEIATRMGELAIEMKSIMGITKSLSHRTNKLNNLVVPIQMQIKLNNSIADTEKLNKQIIRKSESVNWGSFTANWKARKIAKYANQSARYINNIKINLTPYISDKPHKETLYVLNDKNIMKQLEKSLPSNSKNHTPSRSEMNEILAI